MPPLTPHSDRPRQLLILLTAALLYLPALGGDFVLDARTAVRDNPIVHRGNPVEIATTDYWAGFHSYARGDAPGDRSGLYRPLTLLTFALSYRVAGAQPFAYHLVDLLLHALAALLLYRLCRSLARRDDLAWWAGLLFAAHPVQSEAVASIVGRADILAALFGFLALKLHLVSDRWSPRLGAALSLAAALLSKESAVALILLIPLADLFQYRTFSEKSYREIARSRTWSYSLYAGVLLAYLLIRWRVLGGLAVPEIHPLDNPLAVLEPALRSLNALSILFRYFGLLLFPVRLSADYSFAALPLARQFWSLHLLLLGIGLTALAVLLLLAWRRAPWIGFGLLWTLFSLAPVANLLLPIGTIMAERLLYLPTAGFAIAIAALLCGRSHRLLPLCCYLLLLLCAGRTVARTRDWRDEYALFGSAVRTQPNSARAWRVFGKAALARGKAETGLAALRRALEILPDYYEVHDDLGNFHFDRGDFSSARDHFQAALTIRNDYPPLWLNLGLARYQLGDGQAAVEACARAILLDPRYVKAHYNLGVLLLESGDFERASTSFENTLSLDPDHAEARANLQAVRQVLERKSKE